MDSGARLKAFRQIARLDQCQEAVNWWRGDWWRHGVKYGDHVAALTDGQVYGTWANCAYVSRAFEDFSRRRENLSFNHHAEVASLDPETQDRLLDLAESEGLSTWCYPRPAPAPSPSRIPEGRRA